jgi:hypothetical protein
VKPRFPREPIHRTRGHRGNYIPLAQCRLLIEWANTLHDMFPGDGAHGPYLVGSAIHRVDYRDVDLRMILDDDKVEAIPLNLRYFNMSVSLWGQQVTGLPIDFQVQPVTEANTYRGPRHAIWISRDHA